MADSSPINHSGTFELTIQRKAPVEDPEFDYLDKNIAGFFSALEHHMFSPATLRTWSKTDDLTWRFEADQLTVDILAVLHGMLEHYSVHAAPISFELNQIGQFKNLLQPSVQRPKTERPPFPVRAVSPLHGQLHIRVLFVQDPGEERSQLESQIEAWSALAEGGYPQLGSRPDESGVGASVTRFLAPRLLEHYVENFIGDDTALNPLINLCIHWARTKPIMFLEVD